MQLRNASPEKKMATSNREHSLRILYPCILMPQKGGSNATGIREYKYKYTVD